MHYFLLNIEAYNILLIQWWNRWMYVERVDVKMNMILEWFCSIDVRLNV